MPKQCQCRLSERYRQYLTLCVKGRDPLSVSGTDAILADAPESILHPVEIGDGINDRVVRCRVGGTQTTIYVEKWALVPISGSLRSVAKRGRIVMGRTSLMGRIAHGIKSGRAFRGR